MAELLWTIITFCFASVQNVKTVFALRFILGMLESPFAVGVLTIMGSWYTPKGAARSKSLLEYADNCRIVKTHCHLLLRKLRCQYVQWVLASSDL
jgi:type III secretory pathway component EscU